MGIYASIAKNDPALAALVRKMPAATVNRKPEIDCSLVHDGFQFATHGDRCSYIGTSIAEKAHWLEQNKGRYQRIEDVQQEPQLGLPNNVSVAPTGPSTAAPTRETEGPQTQATPFGDPGRKRGRRDRGQLDQKKFPGRNPEVVRKLSPERMRMVLDALREYPVLDRAAAKAGIHPKTLAYWLKCSAAGYEGYDIEWQGEQWRFHEHCEAAIAEADDTLHFLVWQMAMGIKFKIDPALVKLGYRGVDAYAMDENGDLIEEGVRQPNIKMMLVYLAWKRPDTWGKRPKRDVFRTGGVLVVGGRSGKSENSYAASIRARKWKSISREVQVPKA
jgi:hypothetical protein